ncbi:hypothetical protein [Demequina sp.]|uniref:hypothetical protein n=1 Tax=Demequina sp. TaxID=2050685 RepID=UPI0025F1B3B6|nr:hypothetical protein [Demequina sp.]
MSVITIHHHLGDRLAQDGTLAHRAELEELAEIAQAFAPGAAAALVDWSGTEIARLRAYAIVSSVIRGRIADTYSDVQREALVRGAFRLVA